MWKKSAEKEVITLIEEHLTKVEDSLQSMISCLESYLQGDMSSSESYADKTHEAESAADDIRLRIWELIHQGAFLPLFREDIMSLVAMVDKIAGHARSCSKFIVSQHPEIPQELKEEFLKIVRESAAALPPLQVGVIKLYQDFSIVREKIAEVNQIEGEVDHLEWDLSRHIFSTELPLANKIHLKQLLDVIVGISDVAQDVSEILDALILRKHI